MCIRDSADSGMLAALHVLAALAEQDRPLSALMADFDRYVASGEINSEVRDTGVVVDRIRSHFADRPDVELDELDGLSGTHPEWGFNVRASNTEPLLRLNAEGTDRATMERVRDDLLSLIRSDS